MTQPSSLNQTFDTSLFDVQTSFSSTETNTSGSSAKENVRPPDKPKPREPSPYKTVPTDVLYTQWASTYDTDGNILQAVDDIQMHSWLPEFVRLTCENHRNSDGPMAILDLGCGTARNTVQLLQSSWEGEVDITGWDSSQAMLEIAKKKCEAVVDERVNAPGIELQQMDLLKIEQIPPQYSNFFDGLISTLVLEHFPIETFFSIIAKVLKSGSFALLTNMHADMGAFSRAGYKTASGERVKATSYVYSVEETIEAAQTVGLDVIGDIREMAVDERMLDGGIVNEVHIEKGQVAERARKWIGTNVHYGMMLKKR